MIRIIGAAATAPAWSHVETGGAANLTTAALVPSTLSMLPIACFTGVNAGTFSVAAGWSSATQVSGGYSGVFEQKNTVTTDTKTAISVASTPTNGTKTYQSDAYELLVAPAAAATPTPPPSLSIADATSGVTNAAPLTLAWPKGSPANGDLLVACVEDQYHNAPATPAGWTALFSADSAFGTALFYRNAGAGEPATVTFGIPSATNVSGSMVRISGAAPGAPLWSHSENAGTASVSTPPLVPTALAMLPVACLSGVNPGSYSVASGWTALTHDASTYVDGFESSSPTTDTTTPVSVTALAANGTQTYQNDAYGLLVAPAGTVSAGVTLTPASLNFNALGAAAQTVAAAQTGNSTFAASSTTCSGIATITSTGNGGFSIAPAGVGACTFSIAGAHGASATLAVSITTTTVVAH